MFVLKRILTDLRGNCLGMFTITEEPKNLQ